MSTTIDQEQNSRSPLQASRSLYFILTQLCLVACAGYLASLIRLPLLGYLGLAVVSVVNLAAQFNPKKWGNLWKLGWAGTLLMVIAVGIGINTMITDSYLGLLAGQIALIIFITGNQPNAGETKLKWNFLGIVWGFAGAIILLVVSYLDCLSGQFFVGMAASVFLLILCRIWFRLGALGIQLVNTLILFLILLPATDFFMRFKSERDMYQNPERYYSYEAAQKNPSAHAFWTRCYAGQWDQMWWQVAMYDTNHFNTFQFRPDTHAYLFHSLVSINHKGFRGPEIPDEKANAYRIVALGESTTFGCTLNRDDRPWPEVLEQMIRKQIHPARPVQVINAGIPAATLLGNVRRLTNEILSLKPDMIISYHGYNGFYMLKPDLPPIVAKPPPGYEPRPLKLLADLEYGIKLNRYKKAFLMGATHERLPPIPPMESAYAKGYRQLIQICETNHIRLVLANYSMAVNATSDPAIIRFYEQISPAVRDDIQANVAHSEIVERLAKENPDVCFVDTHPVMDGHHENFIDLVHFTQGGRQKMAEIFFAAIKKPIEEDLAVVISAKPN